MFLVYEEHERALPLVFHSALASAAVNIDSFFPPPQSGDREKKVSLNVFTISSRKTKQGFVYNAGTAEGQEEKGTGRLMPLDESTGIKHLPSQSTRNHFRSHFRREPLYHHWPFKVEIPSAGGQRMGTVVQILGNQLHIASLFHSWGQMFARVSLCVYKGG